MLDKSRSTASLQATVVQSGHDPGAHVRLRARLSQYELPVTGGAQTRVMITRRDATNATVTLAQTEPGVYEGSFVGAQAGVYQSPGR